MKIVVVGGGGREHAVIKTLLRDNKDAQIAACSGNAGYDDGVIVTGIKATDVAAVKEFCKKFMPDLVVVTPDDPLAMGMVDELMAAGFDCFGPTAAAAKIESSKVFAKNLMKKYGIPTAEYQTFDDAEKALEYVKTCPIPIVIKADGLALGKGVTVAFDRNCAVDAVKSVMRDKKFGDSGNSIVVEEFLTGPEVSVLAFTDGERIAPMTSSMDHKQAFDGDKGPNTGGMGVIAPNPFYTDEIAAECMQKIFLPTISALKKEGRIFKGCIYFGLMLTQNGPKVIEYNCRFGDPETQAVLPLFKGNLYQVFKDVARGNLNPATAEFDKTKFSCCVVVASKGYPTEYQKGFKMSLPKVNDKTEFVFVAGAAKDKDGNLVTNGGRVAGATAVADSLEQAITNAYEIADKIEFKNKFCRSDIGKKALDYAKRQ